MPETVISKRLYYRVWGALLVLLGATVGVAYIHLGEFNTIAAMTIACLKALIIAMYFMHLRYSDRLTWVFAGAGFFWLIILLAGALSEYVTRPWLPQPTVWN
jgi:cytochrome c oxidase subunit 4